MGLALDEPKENDASYEFDGIKFVVENSLGTNCGAIKIDFVDAGPRSGFSISSTNPVAGGGGGCGSSCGTGASSGGCGC